MTGKDDATEPETSPLAADPRSGVLWLTKTDGATANGMTLAMSEALAGQLDRAATDPAIRAIVIRAGGNGFHGGASLIEEIRPNVADLNRDDIERFMDVGQKLGDRIASLSKPVIGIASRGAAGGGLELLLRCDFLFCLDRAVFLLPEVTLGFFAGWGGVQWGGRMMPFRRAQEFLLLGEAIDGREAEQSGIVTRSFADADGLSAHVDRVLDRLRYCSPAAFAQTKQGLNRIWEQSVSDGTREDVAAEVATLKGGDHILGYTAMRAGERYNFETQTREERG